MLLVLRSSRINPVDNATIALVPHSSRANAPTGSGSGHESTTSVSFEEVMYMAQAVQRGSKYGLRMVDMPYMSYHLSAQQAVDNAAQYVSKASAEVMKCEGNQHHAKYVEAIVKAGIPVQGHIGICPMRIPQLGGFAVDRIGLR